jgi:hypothetical protein
VERDIAVAVMRALLPSAQYAKAARTASTAMSQLNRSFHFRDRHIFVRLYRQYVGPHFKFETPAWSRGPRQVRNAGESTEKGSKNGEWTWIGQIWGMPNGAGLDNT